VVTEEGQKMLDLVVIGCLVLQEGEVGEGEGESRCVAEFWRSHVLSDLNGIDIFSLHIWKIHSAVSLLTRHQNRTGFRSPRSRLEARQYRPCDRNLITHLRKHNDEILPHSPLPSLKTLTQTS
jgi:hypothetical protein